MTTPNKHHLRGGISEMIAVALPMVISSACDTIMTFLDRLFLARLGENQMNAAMGGGLSAFALSTFFIGLIGYSTAMVAQNLGAGIRSRCSLVVTQSMLVALAAWPVMIALIPLAHAGFKTFGLPANQLGLQIQYFDLLVYGSVFGLMRGSLAGFFSGIGQTRIVMMASLGSMVIKVALSYVFIYGYGPIPAMEIQGAAWATILAGMSSVAILLWGYLRKENRMHFHIRQSLHFDKASMKELWKQGSPAGMEFFLNMLGFNFIVILFQMQGEVSSTASSIVFNWDMVSIVPLIGVEIGVTSLVGRYCGAGDMDAVQRATRSGLKLGWIFSLVVLLMFAGFPEMLVDVFHPEANSALFAQAFPLAVAMIRAAAVYVMIEAIMMVFSGALRGSGDTFWTMCAMVGLHWSLVGILWIAMHVFHFDTLAAWWILVGIFMLFPLVLWLRWHSGRWRRSLPLHPKTHEP